MIFKFFGLKIFYFFFEGYLLFFICKENGLDKIINVFYVGESIYIKYNEVFFNV